MGPLNLWVSVGPNSTNVSKYGPGFYRSMKTHFLSTSRAYASSAQTINIPTYLLTYKFFAPACLQLFRDQQVRSAIERRASGPLSPKKVDKNRWNGCLDDVNWRTKTATASTLHGDRTLSIIVIHCGWHFYSSVLQITINRRVILCSGAWQYQ